MTLTDLKIIAVSGADAQKFLQGQLTCDVNTLILGESRLGAHCNAKGRVMSVFRITRLDEAFHLEMPSDVIEMACNQLKKYAIFYKNLKIDIVSSPHLDLNWHRHNIEAGIPRLYPQTMGEFLPHYINLVELDAISFTKGCYTGQEIIARMQHRGHLKKHMELVEFDLSLILTPGEAIENIGKIVDAKRVDNKQLALIIRHF